ncbi:hypothetical protein D9M69_373660 [compost metagenome]
MTDTDTTHALGHGLDEAVVDAGGDDQPAAGGAALAGGVEGALYRQLDSRLEVGVVEDDLRVLATHLQLHLGATGYAGGGDAATHAHGTGEADAIDTDVVDHGFADDAAAAHHQVEYPGGEAGTGDDLGQGPGAAGDQVGRLEHHAVAVGQGRGDLPGRDGDREVPGGDQADHAEGFAGDFHRYAGAHRGQHLAGQAQAFAGEELEDVAGTAHLAYGFGQGLALFPRQQGAQFLAAGEDLAAHLVQGIGTGLDTGDGPGREGGAGRRDGLGHLGGVGLGVFAQAVTQVGGVDVARVAAAGHPFPADVVVEAFLFGHGLLLRSAYCAPWASISAASCSYSSGSRSVSGARTGPASWPTIRAPAFTMLTA